MEQDSGQDETTVPDALEQLELIGHFLFRHEDRFHLSRQAEGYESSPQNAHFVLGPVEQRQMKSEFVFVGMKPGKDR